MSDSAAAEPVSFAVVKGAPTDEELAAVVVVLSRRAPDSAPGGPTPAAGWSAYWRSIRTPLAPGPGVWRMSGR